MSETIMEISKNLELTITDITVYKKAENSRHQRDEIFRLIFDQSLTGFMIASLDFTPLCVNNALSKMLGYSKDELLKMKFNDYTFFEDLDEVVEQKKLLI
jgi:PAS domain S-box-containing protein